MSFDTHALERTSPKGESFIGRCTKCGKAGLTMYAGMTEACANPGGISQADALLEAISPSPSTPYGSRNQ